MTAHRTAALRTELARNPAIALASTVHSLALSLYGQTTGDGCLAIRASSENLDRHTQTLGDSPAHRAMAEEAERWSERLPGDPADLFVWCLAQRQDTLLALLAFLAALSINAVQGKYDRGDNERLVQADRLAEALSLDTHAWWTPSVEGFYGRLTKAMLTSVVAEAQAPMQMSISGLKRDDAARYVAQAMQRRGWLPPSLRPRSPASPEASAV